uniref:BPTI/Kunitz inhibitor domain-containing protein n=1 Tax=Pseudonaja textilis TaxID=8673 RepID=A0A670Z3U2_PSETE
MQCSHYGWEGNVFSLPLEFREDFSLSSFRIDSEIFGVMQITSGLALIRFYFNTATGNCEGFFYGGCGGNENNFVTLAECRYTCQPSVSADRLGLFWLPYTGEWSWKAGSWGGEGMRILQNPSLGLRKNHFFPAVKHGII